MSSKFDKQLFLQKLTTQWLGHSFVYFDELASTNTYLKKMPAEEIRQGMICLTDNQTKGRGRYERNWKSESGQNLTFSLVFKPSSAGRFHVLTLACALALVDQLNDFFEDSSACIKWPNDVILNDKKVAGILTEAVFSGNKLDRLVIGIGLNVNQQKFSDELIKIATSVSLEADEEIMREPFLSKFLGRIEYNYSLWHRKQKSLVKSINQNIRGYGQWIGLKVGNELRDDTYKMLGVNEEGKLLMLSHDGEIESFSYEQIKFVTD